MNLIVSGTIEDDLRNALSELVHAETMENVGQRALRFSGAVSSPSSRTSVAELCQSARLDHAFVADGLRLSHFRLLAIDMDSTLITVECIDEMASFCGRREEVSAITDAAMRGELKDFADSLKRRVALLAGIELRDLETIYRDRVSLSPGAAMLIQTAKRAGLRCALISSGFTFFTEKLKELLDFDTACANILEVQNGHLSGLVREPIVDADAKAEFLTTFALRKNIHADEIIVVGDGANDLRMMNRSGLSVAYHAKEIVRQSASISIDFGPLSTLLDFYPV